MKPSKPTGRFRKDLKRIEKRRWDIERLHDVIALLQTGEPLPVASQPHKLSGEYDGLWECHLEHDWLLVYDVTDTAVVLYRTGTHADLFE